MRRSAITFLAVGMLIAAHAAANQTAQRWFEPAHVDIGQRLYDAHCASCHMPGAAGDPDWREPNEQGLLRPPPLNGTAHAWHHPLPVLYRHIMRGSPAGIGNMPAFVGTLSREQALVIIAYFQSLWPDEVYTAWQRMDAASRKAESAR
jgi:mono/diheme cytochrome c family protein